MLESLFDVPLWIVGLAIIAALCVFAAVDLFFLGGPPRRMM